MIFKVREHNRGTTSFRVSLNINFCYFLGYFKVLLRKVKNLKKMKVQKKKKTPELTKLSVMTLSKIPYLKMWTKAINCKEHLQLKDLQFCFKTFIQKEKKILLAVTILDFRYHFSEL